MRAFLESQDYKLWIAVQDGPCIVTKKPKEDFFESKGASKLLGRIIQAEMVMTTSI